MTDIAIASRNPASASPDRYRPNLSLCTRTTLGEIFWPNSDVTRLRYIENLRCRFIKSDKRVSRIETSATCTRPIGSIMSMFGSANIGIQSSTTFLRGMLIPVEVANRLPSRAVEVDLEFQL